MPRVRPHDVFALAIAATLWGARARAEEPFPAVELYTMGPGSDVFSRFGHAALCVRDDETPEGRCYNYGTTDFSTPVPLTWNVLRGRARFWVSVGPLDRMLAWYGPAGEDRTVWRQRIPLSAEAFEALESRLRDDLRPGSREYTYHHFRDNCTTRIRDHIDAVTQGALRRGTERPHGATWRSLVLNGLAGTVGLTLAGELLLGRPLDAETSRWEAMFLPDVMRTEVQRALGATPTALHVRARATSSGSPSAGRYALLSSAAALALASAPRRTRGLVRALAGLALGLAGTVVWALSMASALPELRDNDMRFVLLPTDLALGALRGRALTAYASLRVVMALVASAASALGLTPQPLAAAALVVVVAMASQIAYRHQESSAPPAP